MMQKLLKIIFVLSLSNSIYSQEIKDAVIKEHRSNPIIYAEAFGGFACMDYFGLAGGGEVNYQYKKSLFTLRYSHLTGYVQRDSVFSFQNVQDNDEYAVMYGRRWTRNSHSFSVSAGVSSNNLKTTRRDFEHNRYLRYERYYAVPFEANFKWFKPKRKSSLILNAITPSVGLKVFGSISKNVFVGAGLTLGLGLNKKYEE
ncbi:hypothetical protein [Flavobacterium hungaricum]|uniref:DUF3575 domain-containing protein n=1 Tax=Flavobacterium hungaricum TaxID=2082725 RepID=A0ABR9TQJ3_9FLAO|nr:hypothetical protein [Flavobacterium hungaricum]MBE8727652.1 hypothetical protein [Flavobacterium hungaricum]